MLHSFTQYRFRALVAFVCVLCFIGKVQAQDPVFAQFYASPQTLNPALIGVFKGAWRVNANYREQWTNIFTDAPFRTYHLGGDYRIKVVDDDYFNVGLNILRDEIGGNPRLTSTRANLGLSYMKQLSGGGYRVADEYLVAGAQIGIAQHTLNNNYWYDRQYDQVRDLVDPSLPSGEFDPQGASYLDFNAGLLWYKAMAENQSFYVGIAANHLTTPNVSFLKSRTSNLERRYVLHGGGEIPFSDELSILPSALLTLQGPSMTSAFGANFRYNNHDWNELAIRVGAYYRIANSYSYQDSIGTIAKPNVNSGILSDALSIHALLEIDRWMFGISYDVHLSNLSKPTNYRGAFEFSMIYTHPQEMRVRTVCPKF
jgi:type IX secretion system PorP/SprF family membrane protein